MIFKQDRESPTQWAVRQIQHQAWSEGHDPACPFNSVQPCAQHPNPYVDENYQKEK